MSFEIWLLYLVATIGLSLTPGPNGLLALSHGASYGTKRSLFTISGGVLGFTLLMAVSMAGMGALLLASQKAFFTAKIIGVLYLIYLGIKTWRAPPPHVDMPEHAKKSSNKGLLTQGFFVAVSNPKVIIFFAAFLPQFINPSKPQLIQFAILALTFAVSEFFVELGLAASAQKFIPWMSKGNVGKWFNRATGSLFVIMGGLLATVNRNG